MRDVTSAVVLSMLRTRFLLTRPMRDVTPNGPAFQTLFKISTHTSHAGRDGQGTWRQRSSPEFLLTRPMRDVTEHGFLSVDPILISTHTSHAGRDGMF